MADERKLHRDLVMTDPYYRTSMMRIYAELQTIFGSKEFIEGVGGEGDVKEDGKKASEALLTVSDELRDSFEVSDRQKQLHWDKMYEGFQKAKLLEPFLKRTAADGRKFVEVMKDAAVANGISADSFYDDLYYLNEKMQLGMDLSKIAPESATRKNVIPGAKSWENYALAHLPGNGNRVPHKLKDKEEFLSKAIVGMFKAEQGRRFLELETEFSVKGARNFAAQFRKLPAFKALCNNPLKVRDLMNRAAKNPKILYDTAMEMQLPFRNTSKEKRIQILKQLKDMTILMDGPNRWNSKWRSLQESIRSIDPEKIETYGNEKLQEIYEKNLECMKGRKSLRSDPAERKQFNQLLDVLSVLSGAGEYARESAQGVFDRVNEVRKGHDPNYRPIKLSQFGAAQLSKSSHSADNPEAEARYQERLKPSGPFVKETHPNRKGRNVHLPVDDNPEKNTRYVFQPYPDMDVTQLPNWMKRDKKDVGDRPLRVNTEVSKCKNFVELPHRTERLMLDDAKAGISRILALSESKMYHLPRKNVPERMDGRRIGGTIAVISKREFNTKFIQYMNSDPVIERLAQKYTDPGSRVSLTGPPEKIGVKKSGNKDFKPVTAVDPYTLDVKRIKREYDQIKKEMEKEAGQNAPALS